MITHPRASVITPDRMSTEEGVPTSVDFVRCEPSQMVASYTSCHTYIYDIETSKQVIKLDTKQTNGKYQFTHSQTIITIRVMLIFPEIKLCEYFGCEQEGFISIYF